MSILTTSKTVVGLFSSGKDAERAMNELDKQGFDVENHKIQVIDQSRLMAEQPVEMTGKGEGVAVTPNTGPTFPIPPVSIPESDAKTVETNARAMLTDLGVDEEEASFYAGHVAHSSTLIVLEADEERAAQALNIPATNFFCSFAK